MFIILRQNTYSVVVDCSLLVMLLLANVPSQSEIEARLGRLKQGKLMTADSSDLPVLLSSSLFAVITFDDCSARRRSEFFTLF